MTGYAQALAAFATALVWLAPGLASWVGIPAAPPEPQVIRRTLQWPAGTREPALELSNINGAVTSVGHHVVTPCAATSPSSRSQSAPSAAAASMTDAPGSPSQMRN